MAAPSGPEIPANDFARQWEEVGADALAALDRVGRSGSLILGEEVERFEAELADWWGIEHAVGVASGLDAIEIALRAADLPERAKVLSTPLTAFATTLGILRAGARPVWCDVDQSGGMDLEQAQAALHSDPEIRAILPVHLYGHPLDPDGLARLAAEHDVVLIEDCAQSAGAERGGRPTGLAGLAAALSLYPTKNLGAMGDGGVLLTRDADVAALARSLRNYGQRERGEHALVGLNSRLDELHAAILRSALLPHLDRFLARRREIAARYEEGLAGTSLCPIGPSAGSSARHLFPVEILDCDPAVVIAAVRDGGVGVGRHYPLLCSDQPAARGLGIEADPLIWAHRLARRELSLPIHPFLTDGEVDHVVEVCRLACEA